MHKPYSNNSANVQADITEKEVITELEGFFRTWLKICKDQPKFLEDEKEEKNGVNSIRAGNGHQFQ